jgi:hypothetical protein
MRDANWFLIVGCQRSGTTLMRLILECHSRIECLDESRSYQAIAGRLDHAHRKPWLGLKAPCITEQLANDTVSDIFTLPRSRNPYRGQPLVFLVRDARDTVASMVTLRIGRRRWIDFFVEPTLRDKVRHDPAFVERYGSAWVELAEARFPAEARAALYWRYKVDALFEYQRRGWPVVAIRYEDLTNAPERELRKVCEALAVPWELALLDHPSFAHGEIGPDRLAIGNTDSNRSIDTNSVGRWPSELDAAAIDEIVRFAGPPQQRLYGDRSDPPVGRVTSGSRIPA